jgi:hypothetical protein
MKKLCFFALIVSLVAAVPALAVTVTTLCANTAAPGGSGNVITPVVPTAGSCGAVSAYNLYIPADTDYAKLTWTNLPPSLTLGTLLGMDASIGNLLVDQPSNDQPFLMIEFTPTVNLGQIPGDAVLLIEFTSGGPNYVSGNNMLMSASSTTFNLFDNGAPQTYIQGGQADTNSLNGWLGAFSGLASTPVTDVRVGMGLAGGPCGGPCSENVTVNYLDIDTPSVPEGGQPWAYLALAVMLISGALFGIARKAA